MMVVNKNIIICHEIGCEKTNSYYIFTFYM